MLVLALAASLDLVAVVVAQGRQVAWEGPAVAQDLINQLHSWMICKLFV